MNSHVKRLLKDYGLILKTAQLVLVCVCMNIVSECGEQTIPTWLWIMYSINTTTYAIILVVLNLAHILQKKKSIMEFTYFLLGIILYLVAGISGIIRYQIITSNKDKEQCDEKTVGIILIICSFLMMFDICLKVQCHRRPVCIVAEFRPRPVEVSQQGLEQPS